MPNNKRRPADGPDEDLQTCACCAESRTDVAPDGYCADCCSPQRRASRGDGAWDAADAAVDAAEARIAMGWDDADGPTNRREMAR